VRLAVVLVVACGSPEPPRGPVALTGENQAIAAFRAEWVRFVRPAIDTPLERAIDERLEAADAIGLFHANAHGCAEGIARVRDLDSTGRKFVVHGDIGALARQRDEQCWSVLFLGGMKLTVEGWLDEYGRLLLVWRLPEG
jgi:hypothetical protein